MDEWIIGSRFFGFWTWISFQRVDTTAGLQDFHGSDQKRGLGLQDNESELRSRFRSRVMDHVSFRILDLRHQQYKDAAFPAAKKSNLL